MKVQLSPQRHRDHRVWLGRIPILLVLVLDSSARSAPRCVFLAAAEIMREPAATANYTELSSTSTKEPLISYCDYNARYRH